LYRLRHHKGVCTMRSLWLACLIGWSGSACAATGTSPSVDVPVTITPLVNACLAGSICPPGNWTLVFNDEFNGTTLDTTKWTHPADGGTGRGGDTINDTVALSVSGGLLHLKPGSTTQGGEVDSINGFGPGYYEARLQADPGDWDAFWIITNPPINFNCQPITVGSEVDIMEFVNGRPPSQTTQNVIWGGYSTCLTSDVRSAATATDTFHLWGMLWDAAGGFTFYRDGVQTVHFPGPVSTNLATIILVGTAYPGPSSTGLLVDWFRYYQPN
jgi:beta-glucanase (GH16 family)